MKHYAAKNISKIYIFILCFYLSFETLILNYIPGSVTGLLRYGIEVLGYGILLFVFILEGRIRITRELRAVFTFAVVGLVSAILNWEKPMLFILGTRWVLRYVYVYWIIIQCRWSRKDIAQFFKMIRIIMVINIFLCVFQMANRPLADSILMPHYENIFSDIDSYAVQGKSDYALYGSFGRYGEFAYFIVYAMWLWIAEMLVKQGSRRWKNWLMLAVWAILLVFSYARQAMVAMVISVLLFMLINKNIHLQKIHIGLIVVAMGVCVLLLPFADRIETGAGVIGENITSRYASIFTGSFISSDFYGHGRTWFYTVGAYRLLSHKPLFGFGIGRYGCQTAITYDLSVHKQLSIPTGASMDVYWVSILGQVGLIGLLCLAVVYIMPIKEAFRIINVDSGTDKLANKVAVLIAGSLMCGLVMTFFGSSLSDRYMAFYLWSLMAFGEILFHSGAEGNAPVLCEREETDSIGVFGKKKGVSSENSNL